MYGTAKSLYADVDIEVPSKREFPLGPLRGSPKKTSYVYTALTVVLSCLFLLIGASFLYPSGMSVPSVVKNKFISTKASDIDIFAIPDSSHIILASTDDASISSLNEYGAFAGPYPYLTETPGSQMIEPYKASTISLSGKYADDSNYYVKWEVEGDTTLYTGKSVTLTKTKTGTYQIQAHIFHVNDGYTMTFSTKLFSK